MTVLEHIIYCFFYYYYFITALCWNRIPHMQSVATAWWLWNDFDKTCPRGRKPPNIQESLQRNLCLKSQNAKALKLQEKGITTSEEGTYWCRVWRLHGDCGMKRRLTYTLTVHTHLVHMPPIQLWHKRGSSMNEFKLHSSTIYTRYFHLFTYTIDFESVIVGWRGDLTVHKHLLYMPPKVHRGRKATGWNLWTIGRYTLASGPCNDNHNDNDNGTFI